MTPIDRPAMLESEMLALLRRIQGSGQWFISALELDHGEDGEKLGAEIDEMIARASDIAAAVPNQAEMFVLCEAGDDHGTFEIRGFHHDRTYLEAEAKRLEDVAHLKAVADYERIVSLGTWNPGRPIPPGERKDGYRRYWVDAVKAWDVTST